MDNRQLEARHTLAIYLAREAGEKLLEFHNRPFVERRLKEGEGFVTEADLASESLILAGIREKFPDDEILSEESAPPSYAGYERKPALWVTDPLDGTTNFAFGLKDYAVSIAFVSNGDPLIGAVCLPSHNAIFSVCVGQDAYATHMRPRFPADHFAQLPIGVSHEADPKKAMLHHNWSYSDAGKRRVLRYLERLLDGNFLAIRSEGCAVAGLLSVACGRGHAYVQETLKPWDVAAVGLLIRAAGGTVTGMDGTPWHPFRHDILASNGVFHPLLLKLLDGWQP